MPFRKGGVRYQPQVIGKRSLVAIKPVQAVRPVTQTGKASALAVTAPKQQQRKTVVSQPKASTPSREERLRDSCKVRPKPDRKGSGKSREFIPWCR